MHKNTIFSLVNMEVEASEQTLSLPKDGDGTFDGTYLVVGISRPSYFTGLQTSRTLSSTFLYFLAIQLNKILVHYWDCQTLTI